MFKSSSAYLISQSLLQHILVFDFISYFLIFVTHIKKVFGS